MNLKMQKITIKGTERKLKNRRQRRTTCDGGKNAKQIFGRERRRRGRCPPPPAAQRDCSAKSDTVRWACPQPTPDGRNYGFWLSIDADSRNSRRRPAPPTPAALAALFSINALPDRVTPRWLPLLLSRGSDIKASPLHLPSFVCRTDGQPPAAGAAAMVYRQRRHRCGGWLSDGWGQFGAGT